MPSCLFGGPPVREDLIKLAESQIGFMNIFARPLFEAVADILPAMQFAVEEILANNAVWEMKIDNERQQSKKLPNLLLFGDLQPPAFGLDSTPSPFSSSPARSLVNVPSQPAAHNLSKLSSSEEFDRRESTGSFQAALSTSRTSSLGIEKELRRSSLPGARGLVSRENQGSSRRGSGDASITAILVTQTPNAADVPTNESAPSFEDGSGTDCRDRLKRPSKEKESERPVTAPTHVRRSQGTYKNTKAPPIASCSPVWHLKTKPLTVSNLYPMPQPSSQCHSQVDLSHPSNGNLDGSKLSQWDNHRADGDGNAMRPDGTRDLSWWRQMSTRRRNIRADVRNGDVNVRAHNKEIALDYPTSSHELNPPPPGYTATDRRTTSGKIRSFFKRKPKGHDDPEKQSSSIGSSSQLQTPPTSDPGRSLNSDD